eukprot:5649839-Pleurochrysis_carterae.AAC.1
MGRVRGMGQRWRNGSCASHSSVGARARARRACGTRSAPPTPRRSHHAVNGARRYGSSRARRARSLLLSATINLTNSRSL